MSHTKVSKAGQRSVDRYELSTKAFAQVHGHYPRLGGEDSAWIRGWQSGYAAAPKRATKGT